MSLRDYFASHAMVGLMSQHSAADGELCADYTRYDVVAREAYHLADAMMAAREKSRG